MTEKSESFGVDQEGSTASSKAEPPCTCGVGTVFYSYLHEDYCPFSKAGIVPPPSEEDISRAKASESQRTAAYDEGARFAVYDFVNYLQSLRDVPAWEKLSDAADDYFTDIEVCGDDLDV